MKRYTVVWHQFAQDELLRIWLAAADRQSIADAADAIDRQLAQSPTTKGTIVEDDIRELSVAPIRVLFTVSEQDRLVSVAGVALV